MPNVLRIGSDEFTLSDDGEWSPATPDDASARMAVAMTRITATLPQPGPQDGFGPPGRTMAVRTAAEIGASLVELDAVQEPPEGVPEGTVY